MTVRGWSLDLSSSFVILAAIVAAGFGIRAVASKSATSQKTPPATRDACQRPYDTGSPWNTPIPKGARDAPDSTRLITTVSQPLTSDPTQYTYPVYIARRGQSTLPVFVQNIASIVTAPNRLHRTDAGLELRIPLPPNAQPSNGSDSQLIVWNPSTGDEWGFWQFYKSTDRLTQSVAAGSGTARSPLPVLNAQTDFSAGDALAIGSGGADAENVRIRYFSDSHHMVLTSRTRRAHSAGTLVRAIGATNGYHYNTAWSGVPPRGFASRGAGITYLAGLVRKCEIEQGHIDHALAFAYPYTTAQYVYPATKSDGGTPSGQGLPEGSRLQLDPRVSDHVIKSAWGCTGACFTIAKALQKYGMYLVDNGGHPKILVEDDGTAHWRGKITASTVSFIPATSLRLVKPR